MLVLTRKAGQSLRIGPEIELKILAVHGGVVRLGITAPNTLAILRDDAALDTPREPT